MALVQCSHFAGPAAIWGFRNTDSDAIVVLVACEHFPSPQKGTPARDVWWLATAPHWRWEIVPADHVREFGVEADRIIASRKEPLP